MLFQPALAAISDKCKWQPQRQMYQDGQASLNRQFTKIVLWSYESTTLYGRQDGGFCAVVCAIYPQFATYLSHLDPYLVLSEAGKGQGSGFWNVKFVNCLVCLNLSQLACCFFYADGAIFNLLVKIYWLLITYAKVFMMQGGQRRIIGSCGTF